MYDPLRGRPRPDLGWAGEVDEDSRGTVVSITSPSPTHRDCEPREVGLRLADQHGRQVVAQVARHR